MRKPVKLTNPMISKEIKRLTGERVTANLIGQVRRDYASSARVSALIARATKSLSKKAKKSPIQKEGV